MNKYKPKLKVVSLFSGCGGSDLGVVGGFMYLGNKYSKHNTKLLYANEINEKICEIFNANFEIVADCKDIRKVDLSKIPKHDLLIAGFPCQSFSVLAQNPPRLGFGDERGKLFLEIVKVLQYHKPKYFLAENVKGIMSSNKGRVFPLILSAFGKCGYSMQHKVLNSAHFGIPQKRERVFMVGVRKDIGADFDFPKEIYSEESFLPLKDILETEVPLKYHFSEKAILGMLKTNRSSRAKMNRGRAQNINSPCNTVTAHLAKISLNGTDPVLKTEYGFRRFTPREVARIQGFPDSFKLKGSDSVQYLALGNAIPPVVMWHLIRRIIDFDKFLNS